VHFAATQWSATGCDPETVRFILYLSETQSFPLQINEPVYTTAEVAELLKLSVDTIRSLFEHEPGVLVVQNLRRGIRRYRTFRIPASIAARVFRRLMNKAG
jgi:hypothetical protein